MPANRIGSKVIIQIAGIDNQINQHILGKIVLCRVFHIELVANQLPDFILIQIFNKLRHILVFENPLDDIVRIFPLAVTIPLVEQFPQLLSRMVVIADFLERAVIQRVPVIRIDFLIKHAVFIFPANCGQSVPDCLLQSVFSFLIVFHLLQPPFRVCSPQNPSAPKGFMPERMDNRQTRKSSLIFLKG